MTHEEIHQQLPDYVLGVLPVSQAQEITTHLSTCAVCRQATLEEREIGALVRDTLHVRTRPDSTKLRQLMPPIPRQTRSGEFAINLTSRLAPLMIVLAVLFGSILLSAPDLRRPLPLFMAPTATATSTNTPTATITEVASKTTTEETLGSGRGSATEPVLARNYASPMLSVPVPRLSPTPMVANVFRASN